MYPFRVFQNVSPTFERVNVERDDADPYDFQGMPLVQQPRGTPTGTPELPLRHDLVYDVLHDFHPVGEGQPILPWRPTEDLVRFSQERGLTQTEIQFAAHTYNNVSQKRPTPVPVPVANPAQALCTLLDSLQPPKMSTAPNFTVPRHIVQEARLLASAIAENVRREEEFAAMRRCLEEITSQMGTFLERDRGSLRHTQTEGEIAVITAPPCKLPSPPSLLPPRALTDTPLLVKTIPATLPPCSRPAAQAAQSPVSLVPTSDESTPLKDSPPPPVSPCTPVVPASVTSLLSAKAAHSSKAPTLISSRSYARVTCPAQNLPLTQDGLLTPLSQQPVTPRSVSYPFTIRKHSLSHPERVVLRFTGCVVALEQRMTAAVMRDRINAALTSMRIRVRGVSFTRAGNIAITPLAPCTVADLIRHTDILKECAAHGEPPESVVIESGSPWHSIVASNVRVPKVSGDVWAVEQAICEELGTWNPLLQHAVKNVQLMCKPEDIFKEDKRAVRISFNTPDDAAYALQEGIFAFGESCRVTPYHNRRNITAKVELTRTTPNMLARGRAGDSVQVDQR